MVLQRPVSGSAILRAVEAVAKDPYVVCADARCMLGQMSLWPSRHIQLVGAIDLGGFYTRIRLRAKVWPEVLVYLLPRDPHAELENLRAFAKRLEEELAREK